MHADLIELLTSRIGQDFDGECHLTEEEARDIIDALASLSSPQEPVGYVTSDVMAELAAGNIGGYIFPKGTLRPENEIALFASPVVPVAAKAEAEGWNFDMNAAPRDGTRLLGAFFFGDDDVRTVGEIRYSPDWPTCTKLMPWVWPDENDTWTVEVYAWRLLPAAPTCEGEGQP